MFPRALPVIFHYHLIAAVLLANRLAFLEFLANLLYTGGRRLCSTNAVLSILLRILAEVAHFLLTVRHVFTVVNTACQTLTVGLNVFQVRRIVPIALGMRQRLSLIVLMLLITAGSVSMRERELSLRYLVGPIHSVYVVMMLDAESRWHSHQAQSANRCLLEHTKSSLFLVASE